MPAATGLVRSSATVQGAPAMARPDASAPSSRGALVPAPLTDITTRSVPSTNATRPASTASAAEAVARVSTDSAPEVRSTATSARLASVVARATTAKPSPSPTSSPALVRAAPVRRFRNSVTLPPAMSAVDANVAPTQSPHSFAGATSSPPVDS